MQVSVRSYLSAGVAVVGAGAMTITPVQPPADSVALTQQAALTELAVRLAAAVTPVDPFQNVANLVDNTGASLITLINDWTTGLYVDGTFPFPPNTGIRPQPLPNNNNINGNLGWRTGGYATGVALPIVSQVIDNLLTYVNAFPDLGAIAQQIIDNIGDAFGAPFAIGVNQPGKLDGIAGPTFGTLTNFNQNVNAVPYIDLGALGDFSQRDIGALLPVLAADVYASLKPVIDFATTPISGLLVGAIGPIVGPVLSLVNSVTNTVALLQESDFLGALTELVNIPVNVTNALLNGGQVLDLTGLLEAAGIELPSTIGSIGLQMGGLLSPGGVAFDGLAAVATLPGSISITTSGLPVGPIGALISMTNHIANAMKADPAPTPGAVRAAAVQAPAAELESAAPADESDVPVAVTSTRDESSPLVTAADVHEATDSAPAPTRERKTRGGNRAAASAASDSGERVSAARGAASRRAG